MMFFATHSEQRHGKSGRHGAYVGGGREVSNIHRSTSRFGIDLSE
jgi:hypothetical protein